MASEETIKKRADYHVTHVCPDCKACKPKKKSDCEIRRCFLRVHTDKAELETLVKMCNIFFDEATGTCKGFRSKDE